MFPYDLPGPTAWYLTLYVVTFAIHQGLVHYVLAGSIYVAWAAAFPGRRDPRRIDQPLAATLADWMPFSLSAAITAGVAPLLFVQIVYPRQFYTANLLLAWRWLAVIPVLIGAFYLLYVVKSANASCWSKAIRPLAATIAAVCFVFVGFCWTANHLLANTAASWPNVFATGELPFTAPEATERILVWLGGAFATMAAIAGWQMLGKGAAATGDVRRLAIMACAGLAIAICASGAYAVQLGDGVRDRMLGSDAIPYVGLSLAGAAFQFVAWLAHWRLGRVRRTWLIVASLGCVAGLFGVACLRELFRTSLLDLTQLFDRHRQAAETGGLGAFLIAAVINFGAIAFCVWLVRQQIAGGRPPKSP